MSEKTDSTLEDYVGLFREDNGLMPQFLLNVAASCNPRPDFINAALLVTKDAAPLIRARGAHFMGVAKRESPCELISPEMWTQVEARLLALLQDPDERIQTVAAEALGNVSPTRANAELVFPILFSAVEDPETNTAQLRNVANATKHFATVFPQPAIWLVRRLLDESDSDVVMAALVAAPQCGSWATSVLPVIRFLAKSRDKWFRHFARKALRSLGFRLRMSTRTGFPRLFWCAGPR